MPSAAGEGQRQHGEHRRQRARRQQHRPTAASGFGRRVLVSVVVGVVGGGMRVKVGKLRDELERVRRGVDDLGVLEVAGHVRRDLVRFDIRGRLIRLVGLIGYTVMAVPVGGRGADFGDQVGDTERAVGVTSDLFGVTFPVLGGPVGRCRKSLPRSGRAPMIRSGVVLAVTHVSAASETLLRKSVLSVLTRRYRWIAPYFVALVRRDKTIRHRRAMQQAISY